MAIARALLVESKVLVSGSGVSTAMHRKGVLMVFKPAGFCPYPIRKKDPNPQSEKNAKTNFQSTNQVAIARALLVESKVLVLDEALAGLEPISIVLKHFLLF